MRTVLHLLPEEIALFQKLPERTKGGWEKKIVEETIDAFESEEELERQLAHPPFAHDPDYLAWVSDTEKKMNPGGELDSSMMDSFPERLLPEYFRNIGACGLCAIIELALKSPSFDEQAIASLAQLTSIRHQILTKRAALAV